MSIQDETFAAEQEHYHRDLAREFEIHADLKGKMFRPKKIAENPFANYIPISYSMTLVDLVGGVRRLLEWWEAE